MRPFLAAALSVGLLAACSSGSEGAGSSAPETPVPSIVPTEPSHAPVTRFPMGVKYARVAFDRYQPYLNELGGGSGTFYEAVWCDVEPQEGTLDTTNP